MGKKIRVGGEMRNRSAVEDNVARLPRWTREIKLETVEILFYYLSQHTYLPARNQA